MKLIENTWLDKPCGCGCGFHQPSSKLIYPLITMNGVMKNRFSWIQDLACNSLCRCPKHNAAIDGAANSYHLNGLACDVGIKSRLSSDTVTQGLVKATLEQMFIHAVQNFDGVIFYDDFIHVDVRGYKYIVDRRS